MQTICKPGIAGVLFGFLLVVLATSPLLAQEEPAVPPGGAITHQQMDEMMDAMHGEGASQRMHDEMGPEGEAWMDRCAAMMGMMMDMRGMMGEGGAPGMQDMMRRMMGR